MHRLGVKLTLDDHIFLFETALHIAVTDGSAWRCSKSARGLALDTGGERDVGHM